MTEESLSESIQTFPTSPASQQCLPLKLRFKCNQEQLQLKFRVYLNQHRNEHLFLQKRRRSIVQELFNRQLPTMREIRSQKSQLLASLSSCINEQHYLHNKKEEQVKTFYKIKSRFERVTFIREKHRSECKELTRSRKEFFAEIKREKIRSKEVVDQSRYKSAESRLQNQRNKFVEAEAIRKQSIELKTKRMWERQDIYQRNKAIRQQIREKEKGVRKKVTEIYAEKFKLVSETKLQSLFRQLAQKEEVKVQNNHIKNNIQAKISQLKKETALYASRIRQYRQNLCQSQVWPKGDRHKTQPMTERFVTSDNYQGIDVEK